MVALGIAGRACACGRDLVMHEGVAKSPGDDTFLVVRDLSRKAIEFCVSVSNATAGIRGNSLTMAATRLEL